MASCGIPPGGEYQANSSFHIEKQGRVLLLDNPKAVARLLELLLEKSGLGRIKITTNNLNHGLPKFEGDLHDIEQLLEMIK